MTIKLGHKYLFILAVCTFIGAQKTSNIAQKIAIENSYQQKVSAAVSSLLGEEKFLVIVSIEFSSIGGTLKKTPSPQSGSNSQGTYIPGLPTVPSNQGSTPLYNSNSNINSESDLHIGQTEVIVGMNETSINGSIKQEIKSLIETIIPQTKDCDDCIKIQAMQFQANQKNEEIDFLKNELENLQTQIRQTKLDADEKHLNSLEEQLVSAQSKIDAAEVIAFRRELKQLEEDSIRFAQLVEAERSRKAQDSIRFINTEERLERVMESKIKSDSVIIREAMGIMKHQVGASDDESLLGMQLGGGSSSIMSYVLIIFLIISLMVVTFLAANNRKPKTVYLKPKDSVKNKNNKKKNKDVNDEKIEDKPEPNESTNVEDAAPEVSSPSQAPRPDEDAMRSELKSLRQTAVSLTVGEKEGASTLIKEWLEDNPNKEESTEEAGEE